MPTKKQKLEQAGLLQPGANADKVDKMLKSLSHNDVDELISLLGASNFTDEPIPVAIVPDPRPWSLVGRIEQSTERAAGARRKARKRQRSSVAPLAASPFRKG